MVLKQRTVRGSECNGVVPLEPSSHSLMKVAAMGTARCTETPGELAGQCTATDGCAVRECLIKFLFISETVALITLGMSVLGSLSAIHLMQVEVI